MVFAQLIKRFLQMSLSVSTLLLIINKEEIRAEEKNFFFEAKYQFNVYKYQKEGKKFLNRTGQIEEKNDAPGHNIFLAQQKILDILKSRFAQIPYSLIEQVNQISDRLLLKQLHQIAQVSSSLKTFQNALNSMKIRGEQTTYYISNYSYFPFNLSQYGENKGIDLLADISQKLPIKEIEKQEAVGDGQKDQFNGDSTPTNCRNLAEGGVLNPRADSPDSAEISSKKEEPLVFCLLPFNFQPKADKKTLSSEIDTANIDTNNEVVGNKSQKMLSLLDMSPQMLMLMRKSLFAFGAPTTVVEDFASNTQLTGDWGGTRLEAAEKGIFFEVYSTTIPQGIARGDNNDNSAISQSFDAYLNLDTGRLGAWPGGIFQFTFQSRFGSNVNADAGSIAPVNSAVEWPIAGPDNVSLMTEYYLLQSFSPQVLFLIGKFNPTAYADVNVFANNYRYQFQNFALNNNLIIGSYAPVSTWSASLIWQPAKWVQVITGVIDPNASAENFADNFFKDVTIFQEYNFAYKIGESPGNIRLIWALNTKDPVDLENPLNFTTINGQQRVDFRDPIRRTSNSFAFLANFDQYLFTIEPETTQEYHQRSETSQHHIIHRVYDPPQGLGVFGRFGIGPERENLISLFASFGIGGIGLIPGREYDQFGLGWYYVGISGELEDFIREFPLLSNGLPPVDGAEENGLELYYNFAITPAIQLTANAQYIFNPTFSAKDNTLILGGRLQIDF